MQDPTATPAVVKEPMTVVQVLDKNIDQQQLAKDLVHEFLLPFLQKKAAETSTTIDDWFVEKLKKLVE